MNGWCIGKGFEVMENSRSEYCNVFWLFVEMLDFQGKSLYMSLAFWVFSLEYTCFASIFTVNEMVDEEGVILVR